MSTSNWTDRYSKLVRALKEQEDRTDIMKCVKKLIENGVTVHDIMTTAIYENRIEFVDSAIKIDPSIITYTNGKGKTYLHLAISDSITISQYNIIQLMIKNGFDVNARANHGITPLMVAIKTKRSSIVRLLVKNGANIDGQADNGYTALMISAIRNPFDQIANLIKLGASVNMKLIAFCT